MDKGSVRYFIYSLLITVSTISLRVTTAEESCEESLNHTQQNNYLYVNLWSGWRFSDLTWHNMTLWDGHMQIPEKDHVALECFTTLGNLLVIADKHPNIEGLTENITDVKTCIIDENQKCINHMNVLIRKCNGNLLYKFVLSNISSGHAYICFDRIYSGTPCKDAISIEQNGNPSKYGNILKFTPSLGWTDTSVGWIQYVWPSLADKDIIFDECSVARESYWYIFSQEPLPSDIGEEAKRIVVCYVSKLFGYYNVIYDGKGNCHYYAYVRSCNGNLQYDLSAATYYWREICLIHNNSVKVHPRIVHEETTIIEEGKEIAMYTSSLQYRCSFDVMENTQYKANWYINGSFRVQMGPSSDLDDLVFKDNYLTTLKHGYEVICGIFPAAENESTEAVSDAYYAGWKIQNENIILSKSGVATVTIEQTIPLGCSYREDDAANCLETLTFEDIVNKADDCSGGIEVKSFDDPSKPFIEIKKLRKGEVWAKTEFRALLSSLDNNYDDWTDFDLLLLLTNNSIGYIGESSPQVHIVGAVHVVIVDINRHWNKRCYSHVDPHMKTVDGIHYEAQKEGDYMLFLNEKYQTEIQTSARYCSPGNTRAVCACGEAVAVGADVFIINICHDKPFRFDLSCVDGGNIDIIFIHDYRYLVRTPIGTMIEILLRGHVMNIDVYMSPKDFGNVAGLCGNFDGDRSNDLEHRDGTISYDNNISYRFADSWRLTDEENLFKNPNRKLDHWNRNNFGKTCTSPNSITRKKCKLRNRQRQIRSISEPSETKMNKQYRILSSRKKRNTISLTEDEAFQLCNHSIYTTPAVQEFPDHLAEEDPDIVVEQCVYDLTQGNDTAWIDAHVSVLNNAVDTILRMSPGFVANNTEKVNSFRIETCLNNCSGNGVCAITGLCECSGTFKGPDCSIDIRIPPVVFEIEGDGVCTVTDEDDCTCFQIRTDNIFDGFMCNITQFKVFSNGKRMEESSSTDLGYFEDIFTGECCVPVMIKNSSSVLNDKTDKLSVIMYEISISNDGANYGDVNPVYVYDTKCVEQVEINDAVTFKLKDNFCLIDDVCIARNLDYGTCFICDPVNDPYGWTKDACKDSGTEIGTGIIVGIVIGSILFVVVLSVVIYIFAFKVLKKHSSSIGVQQKAMVPTHNLQSKMPHQKQSAKIQISARPNIEQNIMIGTAHHINKITDMLHVEKGASAQETDVFYTPIDKYETEDIERKVATPSDSKLKRDISFINIELE